MLFRKKFGSWLSLEIEGGEGKERLFLLRSLVESSVIRIDTWRWLSDLQPLLIDPVIIETEKSTFLYHYLCDGELKVIEWSLKAQWVCHGCLVRNNGKVKINITFWFSFICLFIFIIFFFLIPKLWKQKLVYPASLVLCYQGYNHFLRFMNFEKLQGWKVTSRSEAKKFFAQKMLCL